jgi:hypothetical protein
VTDNAVRWAKGGILLWEQNFLDQADAFQAEALEYVSVCFRVLGIGIDVDVTLRMTQPEIGGPPTEARFVGRVESPEQLLRLQQSRMPEWVDRFVGAFR